MSQLQKVREKWIFENVRELPPVHINALTIFQDDNNIILPDDFKKYFEMLNGTGDEYTDVLYEFYSIGRIKKVSDEFIGWQGVPNYQALLSNQEVKDLFVFANYSFNLFAYAIRLYPEKLNRNEVYVLCGENYKKISETFSEFLDLYLGDSIELQLNREKSD
jgi:hypothetical protein